MDHSTPESESPVIAATWKGRHILYCPTGIDWDAQYNRAVKLVEAGCAVWVHRHSSGGTCPPNDHAQPCYHLTPGAERSILGPDSTTGTEATQEPANDN